MKMFKAAGFGRHKRRKQNLNHLLSSFSFSQLCFSVCFGVACCKRKSFHYSPGNNTFGSLLERIRIKLRSIINKNNRSSFRSRFLCSNVINYWATLFDYRRVFTKLIIFTAPFSILMTSAAAAAVSTNNRKFCFQFHCFNQKRLVIVFARLLVVPIKRAMKKMIIWRKVCY